MARSRYRERAQQIGLPDWFSRPNSRPTWLPWITALFVIAAAHGVFFAYLGGDSLASDSAKWGQYGDFVGGVTNPILSFFALVVALMVVDRQRETSARLLSLQVSLELIARYDDPHMQKVRAHTARSLLKNAKFASIDDSLLGFFEDLGHLSRRGLLDWPLVYNAFAKDCPYYWHAAQDHVAEIRRSLRDGALYEEFSELAKRFREITVTPRGTRIAPMHITSESLVDFLRLESTRLSEPDPPAQAKQVRGTYRRVRRR